MDPRPQFVEISNNSGLMCGMSMVKLQLVAGCERSGVIHLAGGGDSVKIGRGHLLHYLAPRRHFGEMSRFLGCPGALKTGDNRAGEEHLAEVDLSFGELVAGDEGEPRGRHAAGKKRTERFESTLAEAQRNQVLLVCAGIASERDGGQKLLEGLFLFALDDFFAVLRFLQSEVIFKASANGLVQ